MIGKWLTPIHVTEIVHQFYIYVNMICGFFYVFYSHHLHLRKFDARILLHDWVSVIIYHVTKITHQIYAYIYIHVNLMRDMCYTI